MRLYSSCPNPGKSSTMSHSGSVHPAGRPIRFSTHLRFAQKCLSAMGVDVANLSWLGRSDMDRVVLL